MQLHACLLLFIITTDRTLASSHHRCGGNVSLDQVPAGHITLTPLEASTKPSKLVSVSHQTDPTPPLTACTWTVELPQGRPVLLKPVWLDSETSIFVHCIWSKDPWVLRGGGATLLSGCDSNKASLTLTGTGWSSDTVQLDYYVQENERNSSEDHTSPHSDPDLVRRPQTGTSLPSTASVGQEAVSGTEGSSEGLQSTSVSGPTSVAQRLWPTSPTLGLATAGPADRETLLFPEEEANNGADTSARTHLADRPMAASEGTHPYFHTQHTPAAGGRSMQTQRSAELPKTQGVNVPTNATSLFSTDTHTTQNPSEHTHTAHPTVSAATALLPRGVTVGGPERPPDSWRSQRSTDGLEVNPTVTHDPSKPPGHTEPTTAVSPTHATEPHTARGAANSVAFSQPNDTQTDSVVSAASVPTGHSSTNSITPSPGRATTSMTAQRNILAANTDSWSSDPVSLTPTAPVTLGVGVRGSVGEENTHRVEAETLQPTRTLVNGSSPTRGSVVANSRTPFSPISSSAPEYILPAHTWTPTAEKATTHAAFTATPTSRENLHSSSSVPEPSHKSVTAARAHEASPTSEVIEEEREDGSWRWSLSNTTARTPTAAPSSRATPPPPTQDTLGVRGSSAPTLTWSSTTTQMPKIYIVPDQAAAIRVESIELLLQIVVEESTSASPAGLVEDTAVWVEPYLLRASGYSRLMGVWSSGHAVQSLVEFHTSGALQWLSAAGPASLLEQSGLAQAVREGRTFRSSKITNITLGGLQGDVCDWLLQCPAGYKCESQPGTANYSCSSVCHFDFCHHHGICTHHPGQLPVCRCLVGEDFWFMGKRCDVRMTRARLVGSCLAILLIMVAVIAALAFVAVRRYRAILIQAKVDQTRSSYRRFNHFDELSGRFWLRSLPGSADSLDNPAFTRSDELLHLRALDRPCCYHDDTLSLASTCPSHGTRINTIYPHSSQYGWRGSEMSMGDGVLDSGKASDLSVCSWPVEPIHWTPFPLLQQLAAHRTPTVRVTRPRSYCEGMELVDMGKSWTA